MLLYEFYYHLQREKIYYMKERNQKEGKKCAKVESTAKSHRTICKHGCNYHNPYSLGTTCFLYGELF